MVYPDYLLIDFDLLRRSPRYLNIAGIGDILSIHGPAGLAAGS